MGYVRGESTPVLFAVAGAGWAPVRQRTYRGSHESTFDKPHLSFGAKKRKVAPSNAGSLLVFFTLFDAKSRLRNGGDKTNDA